MEITPLCSVNSWMSYLLAGLKEEVERSGMIRECEGGRSLNSKRYALVEDFQQQVVKLLGGS